MKHDNTEKNSAAKEVFEWIETAAIAVVIVVCIFTFICRVVMVDGPSMTPTLLDGQRVVVAEIFYKPKVGDVVIACIPGKSDPYVKRVIAAEGQTVDFNQLSGKLMVDGVELDEPYLNEPMTRIDWYDPSVYPLTLGKDEVFICGDNRNHSNDSRYSSIGPVDVDNIMGRVVFVLTPFNQMGKVK